MIYKYDDIVKTTEETYSFPRVGQKDIGKAITIKETNGNTCGGYIKTIIDSEIIYSPKLNEVWKERTIINAKLLYHSKASKVSIYDPNTGQYDIYNVTEFVKRSKEKHEFNTDILIPGMEFFMEANGRCGIVKVLDCGEDRVLFKEEGFIDGIRHFSIEETSYDLVIPNPIQLKTLDELTSFDLFKRGFNGDYKLRASTIAKIKDILDEEDKSDDE